VPLLWAASEPEIEIGVVTELLDRGADVNQRNSTNGETALGGCHNRLVAWMSCAWLLARHAIPDVPER